MTDTKAKLQRRLSEKPKIVIEADILLDYDTIFKKYMYERYGIPALETPNEKEGIFDRWYPEDTVKDAISLFNKSNKNEFYKFSKENVSPDYVRIIKQCIKITCRNNPGATLYAVCSRSAVRDKSSYALGNCLFTMITDNYKNMFPKRIITGDQLSGLKNIKAIITLGNPEDLIRNNPEIQIVLNKKYDTDWVRYFEQIKV